MHASDDLPQLREAAALEDLPEFGLRYLFDDGSDPSSVTVYDPETLETTWITVDADAAVSLEDVR
ncbi:DUF7511 domain-containing protein [Halobaculum roseum]|uniref:DUF7511 domain-containing protein n=1 Tax=Halobaculum roseum TaxID=2175149 RepID=A0ABD5MH04_9EURY|nr:hypothetical protein [Halobaculum roseum]QZY04190.1 hypothetical protein K6T36_14430 [Halobaculum roseum]